MRKKLDYLHYSVSQCSEFARCPKFYFYHRIEGLYVPPKYDPASGKAVHAGLEQHNTERVVHRGLTPRQIVDASVAALEANVAESGALDVPLPKAKDQLVTDIASPVSIYVGMTERDVAAPASAEAVERIVEIQVAGLPFVGYIDLETPGAVIDYKLVGRRKSEVEVNRDPQLAFYGSVAGKTGAFVQLVRGKEVAQLTPQSAPPHIIAGSLAWLEDQVTAIESAKKTGVFPRCAPTSWMCSDCAFFGRCFKRQ